MSLLKPDVNDELPKLLQSAYDEGIKPIHPESMVSTRNRLGMLDGALRSLDRQLGNEELPDNSRGQRLFDACKYGREQWQLQMGLLMAQTGFVPQQTLEGGLEWPVCVDRMDVLDQTWADEEVQFNHLLVEQGRERHGDRLLDLPHMIAETEKADQKAGRYVRWWEKLEGQLKIHPERERVERAMVNLADRLDASPRELSLLNDDLAAATWLQEIDCHEL